MSLPFLLVCLPAHADLISIGALKDNTLFQDDFGAISNGAGEHFFAGETSNGAIRRGLIAFDIAGIVPAGSIIQNAQLTLHMSRTATAIELVELHRVVSNWGEGASHAFNEEGAGAEAQNGDATWLHTFYDTAFWANPGGDFDPVASASQTVGGNGFYTWASADLASDVQDWLDAPSSNFGWIVLGDEAASMTAKRFDTRENADPSLRPLLSIQYTPVPEPRAAAFCLILFLTRRANIAKWPTVAARRRAPGHLTRRRR